MYLKDTLFSVSSGVTRVNGSWCEIEIRAWQYYCITFWSYYRPTDIAYHSSHLSVWPGSSAGVISQDCKGFDQRRVQQSNVSRSAQYALYRGNIITPKLDDPIMEPTHSDEHHERI